MSKILDFVKENKLEQVNLHLGCGGMRLKDWVNIDLYDFEEHDTSRTGSDYDVKMDIRTLDTPDDCVDAILLVHVVEHFVRWETIQMINHYYNKLRTGGKLIVEMPDLDKIIEWYLKGKLGKHIDTPLGPLNKGFTQFYGNQWSGIDFETHRYVWTKSEFHQVLASVGFSQINITNEAKFHEPDRDMFVIAQK